MLIMVLFPLHLMESGMHLFLRWIRMEIGYGRKELEAIKDVFGQDIPFLSSTKSLTGHSLGATGVHEAIYCLLMMENNFLSGSANIHNLDDSAKNSNILRETMKKDDINSVMSNSFGFGGTNATLIFSRV